MSTGLLSSRLTLLNKLALPAYVLGWGAFTWMLFARGKPLAWLFLAALVLSVASRWRMLQAKQVSLQGDTLRLSDSSQEHTVPVSQLRSVRASRWGQPELITLHFARDTGFGSTIIFIAPHRMFFLWGEHPVAAELRSLIGKRA
ncbi:MAG: hypothetical protein ABI858_04910 [Pseudoxanthomonas sp.]